MDRLARRPRAIRLFALVSLVIVLAWAPSTAHASILGSVLDDIEKHIENLQSSLQSQINMTEGNILENMRQSVETLRQEFNDDLNKDLDHLDAQVQAAVKSLAIPSTKLVVMWHPSVHRFRWQG